MVGPGHAGGWRRWLEAEALGLEIPLSTESLDRFGLYLQELLRWGARMNLTGFSTAADITLHGFLESLVWMKALPSGTIDLVDIGSGAGFPGLVLKVARPGLRVVLVEARRRRHSFLSHVSRLMGLGDVRCILGRAEGLVRDQEFRSAFDAAIARAVSGPEGAAALALGFLRPAGIFVTNAGLESGQPLPDLPGFEPAEPIATPRAAWNQRQLAVYRRAA